MDSRKIKQKMKQKQRTKETNNRDLRILLLMFLISGGLGLFFCMICPCDVDMKDYYAFSNNIRQGMLPYKDFSMLQTPLSMYYLSIALRISDSFRSIVVATWILQVLTAIAEYGALREKGVAPLKAGSITSLCLFVMVCFQAAPYTVMSVLFWIVNLYLYFWYEKKEDMASLVLTGICTALCFYSKQNTGAYCLVSTGICYLLHLIRKKKNFAGYVRCIGILCISYLISIGAGLGIFAIQGNLTEFFEFCVFGVSDFVQNTGTLFVITILIIGYILAGWYVKQPELAIMSSFMAMIAYPVWNFGHILPTFIIVGMMTAFLDMKKTINIIVCIALGAGLVCDAFHYQISKLTSCGIEEIARFNEKGYLAEKIIPEVVEYLSDKDIEKYHIVDVLGGFVNIMHNRYDKYYDCFLKGNLGKKTPTEVIQETIAMDSDSMFIIRNSEEQTSYKGYEYQFPFETIAFIKENCVFVEDIPDAEGNCEYSVYKAKYRNQERSVNMSTTHHL